MRSAVITLRIRGECVPELVVAGAAGAMGGHWLWKWCVHGIDPAPVRPGKCARCRPVGRSTRLCRTRSGARGAVVQRGNALALSYADASFDVAVMALVINFVPDPANAVAEMTRVIPPGGCVALLCVGQRGRRISNTAPPDCHRPGGWRRREATQFLGRAYGPPAWPLDPGRASGHRLPGHHGSADLR